MSIVHKTMKDRKYTGILLIFFATAISLSILVLSHWNIIDDWGIVLSISRKLTARYAASSDYGRWFPAYWWYYKVVSLLSSKPSAFYICNAFIFALCILLLDRIGAAYNVSKKHVCLIAVILTMSAGFAEVFYTLGKAETRLCLLWLFVAWLLSRIARAANLGKTEMLYYTGIFASLLLSALMKEDTMFFMGGIAIGSAIIWFMARRKEQLVSRKALALTGTVLIGLAIYVPLLLVKADLIKGQRSYHRYASGLVSSLLFNLTKYIYYYSVLLLCFTVVTVLLITKVRDRKDLHRSLFTIPLWSGAALMILFLIAYAKSNIHYMFPIYMAILPAMLVYSDDIESWFRSLQKKKRILIGILCLLLFYNATAQAFNWALYNKLNAYAFASFLNWSRQNMPENAKLYVVHSERATSFERFASLDFFLNQRLGKSIDIRADRPIPGLHSRPDLHKYIFDGKLDVTGSFALYLANTRGVDFTTLEDTGKYQLKMSKVYRFVILPEPFRGLVSKYYPLGRPLVGAQVYRRI